MPFTARQNAVACVVGLAFILLGSCASTSMVSSKKNRAYSGPELNRLMVVGRDRGFQGEAGV